MEADIAILVTGGAGYIGSHLAHALVDRGERVVVLDTLETGRRDAVPGGARLVVGDVADTRLTRGLMAEIKPAAIVHLAGSSVVPESCDRPLDYFANNTIASHALIGEAVRAGVGAFVFSSTAAVYGAPADPLVDETAEIRPISPYGASKAMVERILEDTARAHPIRVATLRYFNVAGADPAGRTGQSTPAATHLFKAAVQAVLGLRPALDVYGTDYPTADGTCVRDYIHVSDLVSAHLAALDHLTGGGGSDVFNCGYGTGASVLEVIAAVSAAAGAEVPTRARARRAGDPPALVARVDKIRRLLGWRPERACLTTIAADALAWERRLAADGPIPQPGCEARRALAGG